MDCTQVHYCGSGQAIITHIVVVVLDVCLPAQVSSFELRHLPLAARGPFDRITSLPYSTPASAVNFFHITKSHESMFVAAVGRQ